MRVIFQVSRKVSTRDAGLEGHDEKVARKDLMRGDARRFMGETDRLAGNPSAHDMT